MEFKYGQKVLCTKEQSGNLLVVNKVGRIIGFIDILEKYGNVCVEFDKKVNGHNGDDYDMYTGDLIRGKNKYCWFIDENKLRPYNTNKRLE